MKRALTPLLLLLAVACGGETEPGPMTFSEIVSGIFVARGCASCHGGTVPDAGLDLSDAEKAFADLVNKSVAANTWNGTEWEGIKRVEPGDADASALMIVLDQPHDLPSDLHMRSRALGLKTDDIEAIRQWIDDGAEFE